VGNERASRQLGALGTLDSWRAAITARPLSLHLLCCAPSQLLGATSCHPRSSGPHERQGAAAGQGPSRAGTSTPHLLLKQHACPRPMPILKLICPPLPSPPSIEHAFEPLMLLKPAHWHHPQAPFTSAQAPQPAPAALATPCHSQSPTVDARPPGQAIPEQPAVLQAEQQLPHPDVRHCAVPLRTLR
jgi:hypothetical protein